MWPVLWRLEPFDLFGTTLGPIELRAYGFLIALGFILTTLLAMRQARREKIDPGSIIDLAFWLLIAGFLGSRLFFGIVNGEHYYNACFHPELPNPLNRMHPLPEADCLGCLRLWEGGMVWYGGLLTALGAGYLFLRLRRLPFPLVADIALGVIPLGHALGRLGCFCAGCCWGRPTDSFLGVHFPPESLPNLARIAERGVLPTDPAPFPPIHPVQLYEAAGLLLIFLILRRVHARRRFPGQVALTFFVLYPFLRFVVEFFRGDATRGYLVSWMTETTVNGEAILEVVGISVSQGVSLLAGSVALTGLIRMLRRSPTEGMNSPSFGKN